MKLALALVTFLLVAGLLTVSVLAGAARMVWVAFRGPRADLYAQFVYGGALGVVITIGLFCGALWTEQRLEDILFHDVLQNGLLAVALGGLLGIVARGATLPLRVK